MCVWCACHKLVSDTDVPLLAVALCLWDTKSGRLPAYGDRFGFPFVGWVYPVAVPES